MGEAARREETAELQTELARLRDELAEAQARTAELQERADFDPLLNVLNRRGFERELARGINYVQRYGTPAALLFIDLDGFKLINDRHGHAAGDVLLKAVAAGLVGHLRASDLVGRLGGDEFGVVLWNAKPAQAAAKARDLEQLIEALAVRHGADLLCVGASAGLVAIVPGCAPEALIDAADKAMYARKRERHG